MCNACTPILVGLASPILKILFLFGCFQKWPIFPFGPWAIFHGCQNIKINRIGSKSSCKQGLICNACTPILVGVASPVLNILLFFGCLQKRLNFSFGVKKFNQLELAQKIHASRGGCIIQVYQFWLTWPLRFQRFCSFQIASKNSQFPFQSMGVKM